MAAIRCWTIVAAFAAAPLLARADDARLDRLQQWPQWRGPLATGVAPAADPPVVWAEDHNVRWKLALPGRGLSTPVIWGDRLFLTTAIPVGEPRPPRGRPVAGAHDNLPARHVMRFVVLAVDRRDGTIVWQRTVHEGQPHESTHLTASWASSSAVTDGRRVIASFGSAGVFALDLDGGLLWQRDLGDMAIFHGHGEGSSPALHGDTVVINWDHQGDSFLVALDAGSGEQRWRVARDEITSWSTPLVVEHAGRQQVVVSATGRVRGYDLADGKVIWECGGLSRNVVASPVAGGGLVFVGNSYDARALLAIRLAAARGDVTGTDAVAWQTDRMTPYVPSPLLVDGALCFLRHNQGILTCLEAQTGEPLFGGPHRLPGMQQVYASPIAASGRVYVVSREGTAAVVALGKGPGARLELLAQNRLDDVFSASPAAVGTSLYLRGEQHLYRIAAAGDGPPAMPGALSPGASPGTAHGVSAVRGAIDVEIEILAPASAGVEEEAKLVAELVGDGSESLPGASAQTVTVSATVPGKTLLSLPRAGSWRFFVEAARLVAQPVVVEVAAPGTSIELALHPAGRVVGRLPKGWPERQPVTLAYRATAGRRGGLAEPAFRDGPARCASAGGRLSCLVPAAKVDLTVASPGHAPIHFWAVTVDAAGEHDLGAIELVAGGSIAGWVVDEVGRPLPAVAVRLDRALALRAPDPETESRLGAAALETASDERGYFRFAGVGPGAYRLEAKARGYAATRSTKPLILEAAVALTADEPLVIRRQVALEVEVRPPLDPHGRPWRLELRAEDRGDRHRGDREAAATVEGGWRQGALPPGRYELAVKDADGGYWHAEMTEVAAEQPPLWIDLALVEVVGELRRGERAIAGRIRFSAQGTRLETQAADDGWFAVYLPRPGAWQVDAAPADADGLMAPLPEVDIRPRSGSRRVELTLQIPDTRVSGEVVDALGQPVAGAEVDAKCVTAERGGTVTSGEDGSFALLGLPPGPLVVRAGQGHRTSESILLTVQEETEPAPLRLTLRERLMVRGTLRSPEGAVVAAEVVAWPDFGAAPGGTLAQVASDYHGRFDLELDPGTAWVNLIVKAAGFATRVERLPIPPTGDLGTLDLDRAGGRLVLNVGGAEAAQAADRPKPPILVCDGVMVPPPLLLRFFAARPMRGGGPQRIDLVSMAPGSYSLCTGRETFDRLQAGEGIVDSACATGMLTAGGVLTLSSPASSPGASALAAADVGGR